MKKLLVFIAALAMLCTACGEDAPDTIAASPSAAPVADKPEIEIADDDPPDELVIEDIEEGDGAEAPKGSTVTVNYVGVAWSTGEEFDSSYESQPATFPLDGVIKGWTEGIPGMKEGGRRQLTIPPDLAYADAPPPGSGIEPGETLVFIVDLIRVAQTDSAVEPAE
jgi:peptidylprolyl isomerase